MREYTNISVASGGQWTANAWNGTTGGLLVAVAVLVVRQSDGLPGQGWWDEGARVHGYKGLWEGPRAAKLIREIQSRAFEFWATH